MKKGIVILLLAAVFMITACGKHQISEVPDIPQTGAPDTGGEPTPAEKEPEYTKYMMAYFTGGAESVYFAVSSDGYSWSALNYKKPVLQSNVGTTGARDPFLMRSADGKKFYLLATDLCINKSKDWGLAQSEGSKSIVIWESSDLVNWSEPRLCEIGASDAGCVWAPEATYLPELQKYAIYWASRTVSSYGTSRQQIWYTLTEDFVTFEEPKIWITKTHDIIDTTVIKEGDTYYRFSKFEGKACVILESSTDFFGKWEPVSAQSLTSQQGVEGPYCYKLLEKDRTESANYCVLLDNYGGTGYYIMDCLDLASGEFVKKTGYSMPTPKPRHGSVIWITDEEYNRLVEKYGK